MARSFIRRFSFLTDIPLVGVWIQAFWRRYLYYRRLSIWWRNARAHEGPAPLNPFKLYWCRPRVSSMKPRPQCRNRSQAAPTQPESLAVTGIWSAAE